MESQIKEILSKIMVNGVDDEIIQYIVTIKQEEDLDEFLNNIIDPAIPSHVKALHKLKSLILGLYISENSKSKSKLKPSANFQANKSENKETPKSSKSKKSNYVADNSPGSKKGRQPCDCEARIHELINNCLHCGRIVCTQEGSGPCFFCDYMVATREEMELLNSNTKQSDKLYNKLMEQKKSTEWKKAIEARDKLIKADRIGAKKKFYDDQGDYYEATTSNSNEENRKSLPQTPKSSGQMKYALDLATKTFTEQTQNEFKKNKSKYLSNINRLVGCNDDTFSDTYDEKYFSELGKLIETKSGPSNASKLANLQKQDKITPSFNQVVNEDFMAHIDRGKCLSMHQPWASLLIAGIKKHEGRTWSTDHKGRLWIHAGSKEPTDDEILALEELYRNYYNDPTIKFPKKYPTSCLLGCVFVEDCLSQKEYREIYPHGDSDSPYVLICSNPVILPIFLPMSGEHKIFNLSKDIHRQAKGVLLGSFWV